jgi:hypothetical protein
MFRLSKSIAICETQPLSREFNSHTFEYFLSTKTSMDRRAQAPRNGQSAAKASILRYIAAVAPVKSSVSRDAAAVDGFQSEGSEMPIPTVPAETPVVATETGHLKNALSTCRFAHFVRNFLRRTAQPSGDASRR